MFFIDLFLFFCLHPLTNLSCLGIQNAFVAHKSLRAKIVVATILSYRLKLVYIKYLYRYIHIYLCKGRTRAAGNKFEPAEHTKEISHSISQMFESLSAVWPRCARVCVCVRDSVCVCQCVTMSVV